MKNLIKSVLVLVAMIQLSVSNVNAQTKSTSTALPKTRLSIGADAALPIGDFRDRYDWSVGGSVQIEIPVAPKIYFTGLAGFHNFFAKSNTANASDLQVLPLKAGIKYFPLTNFYLQAQAGASFLLNKKESGLDQSTVFSYSPQVGYQFPIGANYIDAGVRWEGNTKFKDNGSMNNLLGLRVAYNFGL